MPTDGTDVKVTILKLQSLSDKDAIFMTYLSTFVIFVISNSF